MLFLLQHIFLYFFPSKQLLQLLTYEQIIIALTANEQTLPGIFIKPPNLVIDRNQLLKEGWEDEGVAAFKLVVMDAETKIIYGPDYIDSTETYIFAEIIIIMSEIKQYAILEYVVDVLQNAIAGSKVKEISTNESAVLDGNAAIRIKQCFESDGNTGTIVITDEKQILYSEDLLETMYKIHENANFDAGLKAALSTANIVINNLNVEAELIFYAVRDLFYELSGSYEFVNFLERDIHHLKFKMSFGDHVFQVIILNEPGLVAIEAEFGESVPPAVKETINSDLSKVRKQINKLFKKD